MNDSWRYGLIGCSLRIQLCTLSYYWGLGFSDQSGWEHSVKTSLVQAFYWALLIVFACVPWVKVGPKHKPRVTVGRIHTSPVCWSCGWMGDNMGLFTQSHNQPCAKDQKLRELCHQRHHIYTSSGRGRLQTMDRWKSPQWGSIWYSEEGNGEIRTHVEDGPSRIKPSTTHLCYLRVIQLRVTKVGINFPLEIKSIKSKWFLGLV